MQALSILRIFSQEQNRLSKYFNANKVVKQQQRFVETKLEGVSYNNHGAPERMK